MTRILIIEGDPHVREGLMSHLSYSHNQIVLTPTVSDAVCLAESTIPDAVIISAQSLNPFGIEVIHRVNRLFSKSRVVAITTAVTAVEYQRNTRMAVFHLQADVSLAIRELLTLIDEGYWDGGNASRENMYAHMPSQGWPCNE